MPQPNTPEEPPIREFCLCIQDVPEGNNAQAKNQGIQTIMYCLSKKRERQQLLNPLDGWFLVHRTIDDVEDLSKIENLDQYKDYEVDLGRANGRFATEYKRIVFDEQRWKEWMRQWASSISKFVNRDID